MLASKRVTSALLVAELASLMLPAPAIAFQQPGEQQKKIAIDNKGTADFALGDQKISFSLPKDWSAVRLNARSGASVAQWKSETYDKRLTIISAPIFKKNPTLDVMRITRLLPVIMKEGNNPSSIEGKIFAVAFPPKLSAEGGPEPLRKLEEGEKVSAAFSRFVIEKLPIVASVKKEAPVKVDDAERSKPPSVVPPGGTVETIVSSVVLGEGDVRVHNVYTMRSGDNLFVVALSANETDIPKEKRFDQFKVLFKEFAPTLQKIFDQIKK